MEANRKNINAAFAKMKEEAKQFGVELLTDPETFIDDDHLCCVWYGGDIGRFKYQGYTVSLEVHGDVVICGVVDGEDFEYTNRLNNGAMSMAASDHLRTAFKSDAELDKAIEDESIEYTANNWIEVFVQYPSGYWSEGMVVDETDNVLDACGDIPAWIKWLKKEFMGAWVVTDPDTMQFRRMAPEKGDGVYELAQVNQYGDDLFHVAHGFVYPSDIDADEQARLISEFGWPQETIESDEFPALLAEASFESAATEYDTDEEYASFEDAARALGALIRRGLSYEWKGDEEMSYYRKKVYDSHNGDSGLNARTGQVVEVLRELTDREADIADVGRMFHVRFADGFETDVFEDELEVHDTVKIIVDGTNTFQVVDSVPLGYVIWNIGDNMADGYLPLCQVGGPDGCQVNPDTLKAVKCDGAQTILDAATCAGTPRAMRRFLGKHQNAEPGSYNDRCVQRIKAALPYLDKLGWT